MSNKIEPLEYKIGDNDKYGNKIEYIYSITPDYIVYRTPTAVSCRIVGKHLIDRHVSIKREYSIISALLPGKPSKYPNISALMASATVMNLTGDKEGALKTLEIAEKRLIIIKILYGRLTYTLSAFATVLFLLFICIISHEINNNQIIKDALNVSFFGSLGAAMSIALSYQEIEIDIDATFTMNILMGSSRIFIGISAALFCLLAIKTQIAFSFVSDHLPWGIWMIAMVSGFVEKLAPNIMGNIGEKSEPATEKNGFLN